MSFKIVLLGADVDASWPEKIREAVPGVFATAFRDPKDAVVEIEDADAVYGTNHRAPARVAELGQLASQSSDATRRDGQGELTRRHRVGVVRRRRVFVGEGLLYAVSVRRAPAARELGLID